MLRPWLEAFPATVTPVIEEIDNFLGYKLSKIIEEGPSTTLTATGNSNRPLWQPRFLYYES